MENKSKNVDEGYAVHAGGRPHKMSDAQLGIAMQLYFREKMSLREVADALHVSHMTIWRVLAKVPADEVAGTEWARANMGSFG